ncbi:piggyBac transposable element-derived protein 4 [Trichonephila clavata]|uniref:PiggyBac transposable element-derived protein 4 n=1 Tax=Trichonephila clavata TaxID=2740835 RepID=A0A8X6LSS9_TRICU|nr:piggyBac transposable element-derived protein 4 [Trichonephila clavata]
MISLPDRSWMPLQLWFDRCCRIHFSLFLPNKYDWDLIDMADEDDSFLEKIVIDDSCSELSSDEDLSSARIFTEVDVKNPPVPCPRFKFSGIPSVHVQFDDTSDVIRFYETFIDFSLMSKIVEETNKYAKQCIQSSIAKHFSKTPFNVEMESMPPNLANRIMTI